MKAGDRIRFKATLIDDATGDHPAFLMANKGDTGKFIRRAEGGGLNCLVSVDWWPNAFWCKETEFEAIA